MATTHDTAIDALAAPSEDGGVLIWPNGRALPSHVEKNRALLDRCEVPLALHSIRELRSSLRRVEPLIMTGHQPSFFHAGVWIKGSASRLLADRVGGTAAFLIVDSDAARGARLEWPEQREGHLRIAGGTGGREAPEWPYEMMDSPSIPEWSEVFERSLDAGLLRDQGCFSLFRDGFLSGEEGDYVSRWVRGVRCVNEDRGIKTADPCRIGRMFSFDGRGESEASAAFVSHLLLDAERFASAYNTELQCYRDRRGIRGIEHPIPDLRVTTDLVETPFWAVSETFGRARLHVTPNTSGTIRLWAANGEVAVLDRERLLRDSSASLAENLRASIRPRALAQMMYARLLCCDLFIHGIGGAKYDQITDAIIRRYFGCAPPAYACVTATLRLPLDAFPVGTMDRLGLFRRIRDIQHNPDRVYHELVDAEWRGLKQAAIEEATFLRERDRRNRAARRGVYERIRRLNEGLQPDRERETARARRQLDELELQLEHNELARSREWFFAFHGTARLSGLAQRLSGQLGVL